VRRARVAALCRSVTIRKPRTLKLGLAGSGTNNILLACLWGGRITAEVRPLHYQLACPRQGVVSTMRQAGPFYDLITGDDLTWGDRDGPLPWPPSPIRRSDRGFRPPEPSQADALFLFLDRRFTGAGRTGHRGHRRRTIGVAYDLCRIANSTSASDRVDRSAALLISRADSAVNRRRKRGQSARTSARRTCQSGEY